MNNPVANTPTKMFHPANFLNTKYKNYTLCNSHTKIIIKHLKPKIAIQ